MKISISPNNPKPQKDNQMIIHFSQLQSKLR